MSTKTKIRWVVFAAMTMILAFAYTSIKNYPVAAEATVEEDLPVQPEAQLLETALELDAEGDLVMVIGDVAIKEQTREDSIRSIIDDVWREFAQSDSIATYGDSVACLSRMFMQNMNKHYMYAPALHDGIIGVKVTMSGNTYMSTGVGETLVIPPTKAAKYLSTTINQIGTANY